MALKNKKPSCGLHDVVSSSSLIKKSHSHQQKKKGKEAACTGKTLQALTSAAIMLPGLMLSAAQTQAQAAEGDGINFQFSRYQEGKRNLFGAPNSLNPIRADVVHGSGRFTLTDRAKFSFSYTQDIWSGATPVTTSPLAANGNQLILGNTDTGVAVVGASPIINTQVLLDRDLNPIMRDQSTGQQLGTDTRSVLVLSSASPETRNQANFRLGYEWDDAAINAGAGFSLERDYRSSFGNLGGRLDFNQKLTSVKFGAGYTSSNISAILDHDAAPYLTKTAFEGQIKRPGDGSEILRGERQDWAANLGLTQILNKHVLIDANFGYTHSNGYLENPYKAMTVIFVDPDILNDGQTTPVTGDVRALLEQRPGQRNQWAFSTKYIQHITPFDAALHLNYKFTADDWGINTNTFSANWVQPLPHGWTITPRIRYYSQDAANFYDPFLISQQNFSSQAFDSQGREIWVDALNTEIEYFRDENFNLLDSTGNPVDESTLNVQPKTIAFDADQLPDNFSSDHRLAGFGSLSGGFTLSKQFGRGVELQAGFEYYTRASSLKLGSDGGNNFADFDYYVANAALKLNLQSMRLPGLGGSAHHQQHHGKEDDSSISQHMHNQPAGLMFSHMLDNAGDFMLGYRFMYSRMAGNMLHGSNSVSDQTIVNQGCSDEILCTFSPADMDMRMHMLDIMYAPTRWLNLMLMPRFMDMEMNLRELDGRPPPTADEHQHFGGHTTGVIGDTLIASLIKLYEKPGHRLHAGLGISAPTGKSDLQFRRVFKVDGGAVHFGMQLGSGTWDFVPSLTYTGEHDRWSWGTQVSGVKRMESQNKSGYRLGDMFQATSWAGYDLIRWLTASVRGVYALQDRIHGDFNSFSARIGPMDFPVNYGGKFWNIGLGVNAVIPNGRFAGHHFGFEWLQPVHTDVNGFQLDRKGALAASWSYQF